MFWSICSSKGGVGASVVASCLARVIVDAGVARRVVLLDARGDLADIFGVETSMPSGGSSPGVVDWLLSPSDVDGDALEHLLMPIREGLSLLPRGTASMPSTGGVIDAARCVELVGSFGHDTIVVADLGVLDEDPLSPRALIAAASDRSVVVVRACYLALRRVAQIPVVIDTVVEVVEAGRSLGTLDIEAVIGLPVTSRVRHDPAVARVVDAGLIGDRIPRSMRRGMSDLLAELDARVAVS